MIWNTWLLISFYSAILGTLLAQQKGRSVAGFWLGLLFGPLGILFVTQLHALAETPQAEPSPELDEQRVEEEDDFRIIMATRGKVGFGFNGRTITSVTKGSAADLAGVKVGDRLVLIDNVECKPTWREALLQITGAVDTYVNIVIRRGGEAFEVTLLRK